MKPSVIEVDNSETAKCLVSGRPQDALLSDMELNVRGMFYPLGYPVEIVTNDRTVLLCAVESFGHARLSRQIAPLQIRVGVSAGDFACPPEPTRREYNHLYSLVADAHNQALLDLKRCISFTWVTKAAVDNSLYFRYNFLEKTVYLLLGASVVTDIHAACIGKNGRGILLCGDSGSGKSTLAYACARAGWTYTSDDTSYLINDSDPPRVIGHSHRARFRPSAKALFPELMQYDLAPRLEGKPSLEIPMSELPVRNRAPEASVHSVVYLNRSPGARGRLVQLPRGTATQRMSRELYSAGEIRTSHQQHLQALWETPTYDLQYDTLAEGMKTLEILTGRD